MSGSSIGMMDKAYFVGRREILNWINDTFSLHLQKIEETASGAVACQILDAIYPGEVPMSKVKWDAKTQYEFIHNYKILQRVFDKKKIDKHVEVEKLIRAKYQDNLEFMQWLKNFYEKNCSSSEYDPVSRRERGKGANKVPTANVHRKPPSGGVTAQKERGTATSAARTEQAAPAPAPAVRGGGRGTAQVPKAEFDALQQENTELRMSVEGLEKERDFYFGKLRDVEILLQAYGGSDKELVSQIFKILYATEEDFEIVGDQSLPANDDQTQAQVQDVPSDVAPAVDEEATGRSPQNEGTVDDNDNHHDDQP